MSIHSELHKLQKELKVPKGQKNEFGGYMYRSCEDIVEAVKKVMPEGYYLTLSDDIKEVGQYAYVVATATFTDGNESIVATAGARDAITRKGMDASQITGSASSYARKYALNGLFCLDDTKDADTRDNRIMNGSSPKPDMSEPLYDNLIEAIESTQTLDELKELFVTQVNPSLKDYNATDAQKSGLTLAKDKRKKDLKEQS